MKKNDILYDIGEEVFFKENLTGRIVVIEINSYHIYYMIKTKNGSVYTREQCDISSLFQEGQYVKIKLNDVEIIGEIMSIDEGTEYFDLRINDDGKYITPCWKSEIVEYIFE